MSRDHTMASDADPTALDIQTALAAICKSLPAVSTNQELNLDEAYGRILGSALSSPMNVPPFRSSAMDGYAFRHENASESLKICGQSLAGHPGSDSVPEACCQRITTGARVPDEADTVVQQENVEVSGEKIQILVKPQRGLNVREIGSDSKLGTTILEAGHVLRSGEVGLLAAHGISRVAVRNKISIGVFSTGDELVDPGATLKRGQIHDANRPLLKCLFNDPCFEVIDLGIIEDKLDSLTRLLDEHTEVNVFLSSGGVSVGEADHVREAISARGDVRLWKVAMKPGRPLAFGRMHSGQYWFGLPGNPVSSAITSLVFVKPALWYMLGAAQESLQAINACLKTSVNKRPGRVEFQRGVLQHDACGKAFVDTTGFQDSHVLSSLAQANCLIELPCDSSGAMEGDMVKVHPFIHFGSSPL